MLNLKKKSGKISKTQILAIVMIVIGYALSEAIEYGLITNPKVSAWLVSVFGFIVMILRNYTNEPLMPKNIKKLDDHVKKVLKSGIIIASIASIQSCVTLDCKDKDIELDIYNNKIEAKCSDGSNKVTLSTTGRVVGLECPASR